MDEKCSNFDRLLLMWFKSFCSFKFLKFGPYQILWHFLWFFSETFSLITLINTTRRASLYENWPRIIAEAIFTKFCCWWMQLEIKLCIKVVHSWQPLLKGVTIEVEKKIVISCFVVSTVIPLMSVGFTKNCDRVNLVFLVWLKSAFYVSLVGNFTQNVSHW